MRKPVYCIRDDVAELCMPPFTEDNDSTAIRAFDYSLANSKGVSGFRPSDFCLLRIGEMELSTGELTPAVPSVLRRGSSTAELDPMYGVLG